MPTNILATEESVSVIRAARGRFSICLPDLRGSHTFKLHAAELTLHRAFFKLTIYRSSCRLQPIITRGAEFSSVKVWEVTFHASKDKGIGAPGTLCCAHQCGSMLFCANQRAVVMVGFNCSVPLYAGP